MTIFANNWTRWHAVIFGGLFALFTVLIFLITSSGLSPGPEKTRRVVAATLATITGPMVGGISRGGQSCCVAFSMQLMLFCAPMLGLATLAQVFHVPKNPLLGAMRLVTWSVGWIVWFGGGVLSFAHALS